jgi:YegS/Rv2252/BmrU family lipid kinase
MKELLYVYNPQAGRQRGRALLSASVESLSAQGYRITVHPTAARGDAAVVAAREGGRYDRVVCCGGDGTLNEVVRGLLTLPEDHRPVMGYIPAGTTNDFSRNLDLPREDARMAEVAGSGFPRTIDVGEAAGKVFTYVAAFGLFTDVSYTTSQSAKNMLGHFAYVLEGAGRLVNVPSYAMTVTTDRGLTISGDFIYGMVGNTVSVGGLVNLPRDKVSLNDGQFEVVLIRQPRAFEDWQAILTALTDLKMTEGDAVVAFSASEITFTCSQPVAWTVDGEFGGEQAVTQVKNLPRAITIAAGSPEA